MSEETADVAKVRACVAAVGGWAERSVSVEPAIPILASPSWRGVDGTPWRVTDNAGGSLIVKIMDADAAYYIDVPCAFTAAQHASDLGVGPKILAADAAAGTLVMEDLGKGWKVGTLELMLDPATVDAVADARRRFQAAPGLPRSAGVFDEIERFHADVRAAGAEAPADVDWMLAELRFAAAALAPTVSRRVPIHGDGVLSNVMIADDGRVRLIDWDRATMADPLEDTGTFLVEAFVGEEPEAREAFARIHGGFDERAFNRARLYGIADDFRWGLIGALVAAKSPRRTHEFYKFANWRFLRCRMAVREPRFGDMVRRVQ